MRVERRWAVRMKPVLGEKEADYEVGNVTGFSQERIDVDCNAILVEAPPPEAWFKEISDVEMLTTARYEMRKPPVVRHHSLSHALHHPFRHLLSNHLLSDSFRNLVK